MTCSACPSQWEGKLEDGRAIYIRYRWGNLTASVSKEPTENLDEAVSGECIYDEIIDDPKGGTLSTEEMLNYTKFRFIGN